MKTIYIIVICRRKLLLYVLNITNITMGMTVFFKLIISDNLESNSLLWISCRDKDKTVKLLFLDYPENGGSNVFQNVGNNLSINTA
jgi:hypothetical protein